MEAARDGEPVDEDPLTFKPQHVAAPDSGLSEVLVAMPVLCGFQSMVEPSPVLLPIAIGAVRPVDAPSHLDLGRSTNSSLPTFVVLTSWYQPRFVKA